MADAVEKVPQPRFAVCSNMPAVGGTPDSAAMIRTARTRSLADFAKLVELFDAQGVSFVSVTQQFNTTTSMGRLTLNVLLSFAQFELGTVRASLASGIKRIDRRWRLSHEGSFGQAGPLRDLYEGLHRSWARSGVQLAGDRASAWSRSRGTTRTLAE